MPRTPTSCSLRLRYEATGRSDEYRQRVERLKKERAEFLSQYPSLSEEIVRSVG